MKQVSGRLLAACGAGLLGVATGCSGAPEASLGNGPGRGAVTAAPAAAEGTTAAKGSVVDAAERPAPTVDRSLTVKSPAIDGTNQDFGPSVLLPNAKPDDSQVMRIAGVSIHKSHVFDRLYEKQPREAKIAVDALVFDILLAQKAKKHEINFDASMVDEVVDGRITEIKRSLKRRFQGSYEEFIDTNHGIDGKTFRAFLKLKISRLLVRYYVIRYLGMLEDRVHVRLVQHHDQGKIAKIRIKALEGAEFHSLALRESEHDSRSSGGLFAPISRDSKVVWRDQAFDLKPGGVSEVIPVDQGSVRVYYLLYCVRHQPGRKISFADAKPELDRDWLANRKIPTQAEADEIYLRLRAASEALNNGGEKR